jgi:hypothetical protein
MEQCLARRPDLSESGRQLFQGGINYNGTKRAGYVIEKRCDKKVSSGKLCEKCKDIRINDRDPKTCAGNLGIGWYGFVTDAITSNYSFGGKYIFGGLEWLKDAAAYGISQEGLEKGIAAHNDAVKGLNGVPPLPDMSAMVKKEVTNPPPKKEKKTKAKKDAVEEDKTKKAVSNIAESKVFQDLSQPSSDVPAPPLVVSAPPANVEVKKRAYKKKVSTAAAPPPPLPDPIAILSEEKPVDVDNVETIEVTIKYIDGKDYYYDSRSHKNTLYNPKNGEEIGQYDSVLDKIIYKISIPDAE